MPYQKRLSLTILAVILGLPFSAKAQLVRPTTMGVGGSNESFTQKGSQCFEEKGTLGGLVTDGTSLFILSAAHVIGLGISGYLSSGSGEPIVQPSLSSLGKPPLNLISCPPTTSQLAVAQVATLSTVVPITFNTSAQNTYDAALAKILPGSASSSINGISAFSGTLLSPVNKGLKVQKVGAETGMTERKGKGDSESSKVHHLRAYADVTSRMRRRYN